MDCSEVRDLLDAYALGAAEKGESRALEEHVADCVRCWDELNKAQRTAALLSLAVAIEEAPPALRERVLARARREERPRAGIGGFGPLFRRRGWLAAAGAWAVAAVAALALAAFLQVQMDDLRGDNRQLERQVSRSDQMVEQQRQVMAVLTAPDVREVTLPSTPESPALGVYYWSRATRMGFLVCNNLPKIEEGQVYQAWFLTGGKAVSAGTFEYWNGIGQLPMDLSVLDGPPEAIALSIEGAGGSDRPTGQMLLWGSLSNP